MKNDKKISESKKTEDNDGSSICLGSSIIGPESYEDDDDFFNDKDNINEK